MIRRAVGVLEGASVVAALCCVPLALLAALRAPVAAPLATVVEALVAAAALAWAVVTVGLVRLVAHQLRGGVVDAGVMGWAALRVAALVLLVAPLLDGPGPTPAGTPSLAPRRAASSAAVVPSQPRRPSPPSAAGTPGGRHVARGARRCRPGTSLPLGTGLVLVPLAADARRRARRSRRTRLDDARAIDVEASLLSDRTGVWPPLGAIGGALAATGRLDEARHVVLADGTAVLDDGSWRYDPAAPRASVRALVVPLGGDGRGVHVLLVPRGASLRLAGADAASLVEDAARVGEATGLGRPTIVTPSTLLRALALRDDDEVVVCVGSAAAVDEELRPRCVVAELDARDAFAAVSDGEVTLADGRVLDAEALSGAVRALVDGDHDAPLGDVAATESSTLDDRGVVVRLLTAVPRVDGLIAPLEPGRERRAVELLAYLALRDGTPVTGERLRVRVLGTASTDAAAKTLFNVASSVRRSLGEGAFGPRLPAAGRVGRYTVAPDVSCDVTILEARVAQARRCDDPHEAMAWLRAALELVESEPFATVLEGYDWFLAEGHLARLQAICEDAACDLVTLALAEGLVALATVALERATLVDPHSERLAAAAARVAAARGGQASLDAIAPAARSTEPSAPAAR